MWGEGWRPAGQPGACSPFEPGPRGPSFHPVCFLKPHPSLLSARLVSQGGCSLEDSVPALVLDLAVEETQRTV